MKAFINILLGLALVAVVVSVVFFFTSRADEKEQEAAPPKVEKIVYMSTSGIVDNIERRLAAKAFFPVTARCPKKVDEKIGTTFRCSVRRDGADEKIAIASVEIVGAGGQFRWTSTPTKTTSPTPTETAVP